MASIYELTADYVQLMEMMEDPEIDPQVLMDTIEGIEGELEIKADGYAKIMKSLESDANGLKAEVERLNTRRQTIENNIKRMKQALQMMMEATNKTKFKTDLFSFGIQNNPASVVMDEQYIENLPEDAVLRKDRLIKYMDPSHPVAKKRMIDDILQFRAWGYDMIKHDFAGVDTFGRYGFLMTEHVADGDWTFYDRSRTSAEIVLDYYRYTAEAAGDVVINACNTLSHLSAGLFPVYRIGDDTSGHKFEITVKMGVNTLAHRGAQHRAFYAADADCVGITHEIAWEKNKEWLRLLRYSGTSMLVSIEKEMYTAEVREAVTEAFRDASQPHETAYPLDWDSLAPERWQTWDGVKEFNWRVR